MRPRLGGGRAWKEPRVERRVGTGRRIQQQRGRDFGRSSREDGARGEPRAEGSMTRSASRRLSLAAACRRACGVWVGAGKPLGAIPACEGGPTTPGRDSGGGEKPSGENQAVF